MDAKNRIYDTMAPIKDKTRPIPRSAAPPIQFKGFAKNEPDCQKLAPNSKAVRPVKKIDIRLPITAGAKTSGFLVAKSNAKLRLPAPPGEGDGAVGPATPSAVFLRSSPQLGQ